MQNKYKYFLKNLSIFSISSFVSKFLMFFMVLIYTNYLTTSEYGIIDTIATLVSLCIPIFTLSIYEAVVKFLINNPKNKEPILKISISILLKGFIILILLALIALFVGISIEYIIIFLIYYLLVAVSEIIYAYLRGMEKVKEIGISSIIKIICLLGLNSIFLIVLHLGILGYYIAYILSELIVLIYQLIIVKKTKLNKIKVKNKALKRDMVNFSKHYIVNTISWWVNNALDRLMLAGFYDMSITGIYSMAYKIPNILSIVQGIFAQTWQISAMKEVKEKDHNVFYINMFKIYNFSMIFVTFFLIVFAKLIAKILFSSEFYSAWQYTPFLLLAILFGALSGFFATIFAANNNSKLCSRITLVGAIINLIFNLILIPKYNAYGAAIATCISYFSIFVMSLIISKKYIDVKYDYLRIFSSYLLLFVVSILLFVCSNLVYGIIAIVAFILLLIINYSIFKMLLEKILKIKLFKKN